MVTILRKNWICLETTVESFGSTKTQTQDLWVKTKSMKESMARIKPTVFQSDTTFSTNREGYKLMIPTYHNTVNNKTEFAGLLFLATETKDNIEVGLQFFKDTIDYTSPLVN